MKPLRILHTDVATGSGGQEQYVHRMIMAMRARGHHVELACQPQAKLNDVLRKEGVTVHAVPMSGAMNFWRGMATLARILRRGKFDVLNTHSRRDSLIAGSAARLVGTPLVVRTRHLAKPPGSLLSYTTIPQRVITSSEFVRQMLIERGVPPEKVACVYPAIPLADMPNESTLREELRLAPNDFVVGCVAVMRVDKGHRQLIDAMEPLIRERPNIHLVCVGGGSPVFEQVQAYVAERRLQKRVHLLGMRNDVPNLLAGFDLFALATRKEAAGAVFVEAGAAGLAVVGTKVDGVPEMVQDGITGLLVPLDDGPALTAAIRRLIDDPELRASMGRAGIQFCRDDGRFTMERMASRTEDVYRQWLKERGS